MNKKYGKYCQACQDERNGVQVQTYEHTSCRWGWNELIKEDN